MCIRVGCFSDPPELEGLAHFLEHMVFMGSAKYPDENGFDKLMSKNGGSSNASTDCERTKFYFEVQRKSFRESKSFIILLSYQTHTCSLIQIFLNLRS